MEGKQPVGVIDSGIGGFTVVDKIQELMPREDIVYLADERQAPYGSKSNQEIKKRTHTLAQLLIREYNAKAIVLACNTATTAAIDYLRQEIVDIPIVGVVPMIKPAAQMSEARTIAVMATRSTIESDYYQQLKKDFAPEVEVVDQICEGWVQMVEANRIDPTRIKQPVEEALGRGADMLVLGCTHFPFLTYEIKRLVGRNVDIIEPSMAVAKQLNRVLNTGASLYNQGGLVAVSTVRGEFDVSPVFSRLRGARSMSI